jgi:hypothetical protein
MGITGLWAPIPSGSVTVRPAQSTVRCRGQDYVLGCAEIDTKTSRCAGLWPLKMFRLLLPTVEHGKGNQDGLSRAD